MITLYLDTSSSFLYTGIIKDDVVLSEVKENLGRDMSSMVLVKVNQMLNKLNITLKDIDKIVVVNGPGSFTGVRIGITIAKTLAWTLNKEIYTISSLKAMSLSLTSHDFYIPLIDARRGYVFAGIYDNNNNEVLTEQYIELSVLNEKVQKLEGNYVYITNDKFTFETAKYDPDILKIVNIAKNATPSNPHSIDALYLKRTEAEENLSD